MDPVRNPYCPGAGTPPPELAGRDEIRETIRIAVERLRIGNPNKSVLLVGLRGVGKTVLLDQMRTDAEGTGIHTIRVEAPEGRSLPAMLAPEIRVAMLRMSRIERAKAHAQRALRGLAGFVSSLKVSFNDIEVGLDMEPEPGLADNGDLGVDLAALLEATGRAAKEANTALVIFVDELQYVEEGQLGALISSLHRCSQQRLPLCVVGAGLPQLRGRAGEAKSYAERLFDYPEIGALQRSAAERALVKPAEVLGVKYEPAAVEHIIQQTRGYPYFLQEWGKRAWEAAEKSPIRLSDVQAASAEAVAALDVSFFRVRLDRLTPMGKRYLRAMADPESVNEYETREC